MEHSKDEEDEEDEFPSFGDSQSDYDTVCRHWHVQFSFPQTYYAQLFSILRKKLTCDTEDWSNGF